MSSRTTPPDALALALAILATSLLVGGAAAPARADGETSPLGYVEMPLPTDGSYTLTSGVGSGRHWGRPELVRFLVFAAREWARRHPDKPRLAIGDMSRPDGGDFPPHKTHKDGLTLDLVTRPKNLCHISYPDQDLTAELAQLLVDLGARQILYNHPAVIEKVKIVQEYDKHDDHFHIVVDPARVPADLGPLLMAPAALKEGAAVGPAGFGKPRRRPARPDPDEPPPASMEDLRIEWDLLGDVRGYQRAARVLVEGDGLRYDSGALDSAKPWHLVEGTFADGARLRWMVEITGSDDAKQQTGWQRITVDLGPPKLEPKEPAPGATAVPAQPTFKWAFADPHKQAWARVEIRRPRARRGLGLDPVTGSTTEAAAPAALPGGAYEWRVVAADVAGNEGSSAWAPFTVGPAGAEREEGKR